MPGRRWHPIIKLADAAWTSPALKGVAPSHLIHHQRHQRRRERAAPARAQPHDALRPHPFLLGEPGGERLGEVREAARFSRPKEKLGYRQRRQVPDRAHGGRAATPPDHDRSEEHTSELQSPCNLVCRLLLEKKKK